MPLPPITQHNDAAGQEIVCIPILIQIPVDPLGGFTKEEAIQVAKDRLAELPLQITLGGVSLECSAATPLFYSN